MRGVWTLLCLLMVLAAACGRYTEVRPIVIGPYADRPNPQLFEAVSAAAQAQGYRALQSDPASGLLIVQASSTSRYGSSTFAIQCYQEGWVRVVPNGAGVRPMGSTFTVPSPLRPEMESLAVRLRESLGGAQ
jgi:hypothetical protein